MLIDKSDHDLLIRHAVKIDTMCGMVVTLGSKFDAFTTKIDERCGNRLETFNGQLVEEHNGRMDIITVRWLIGILVAIICGIIGTVGYNQQELKLQRHTTALITQQIKTNTDDIKQNQVTIGSIQQIILNKINEGG